MFAIGDTPDVADSNLKNSLHEWQSRVKNGHYSVAYFDPITFVKGGAVTCGADASICK